MTSSIIIVWIDCFAEIAPVHIIKDTRVKDAIWSVNDALIWTLHLEFNWYHTALCSLSRSITNFNFQFQNNGPLLSFSHQQDKKSIVSILIVTQHSGFSLEMCHTVFFISSKLEHDEQNDNEWLCKWHQQANKKKRKLIKYMPSQRLVV